MIIIYDTCRGKGYTCGVGKVLPVFLLLAVLRSLRHWNWRTHILEVDTSYTIINFNTSIYNVRIVQ